MVSAIPCNVVISGNAFRRASVPVVLCAVAVVWRCLLREFFLRIPQSASEVNA